MALAAANSLLFINYHYIREPDQYRYPGIHPLSKEGFRHQVDQLKRQFRFATPGEVDALYSFGRPLPASSIFLTFDDGLWDHWEAVCDVLDPMGIKGAFFVCSRPAVDGRALTVHKVHWLRAHTEPENFTDEVTSYMPEEARPVGNEPWLEAAERTYIYDTPKVAHLKYALNFVFSPALLDEATTQMLTARGMSEKEFCESTYMGAEQLGELRNRGHVVGVHGHSHLPFSRLGERLLDDVRTNAKYLTEASGVQPRWLAYPFGRKDALPDDWEISLLRKRLGLRVGLTMLGTWNDGSENPMVLNRVNNNEVDSAISQLRELPNGTDPR